MARPFSQSATTDPAFLRTDIDRIFERFVRVDDARGQSTGGSGLGLAITREIIERHGGIVELDRTHRFRRPIRSDAATRVSSKASQAEGNLHSKRCELPFPECS